MAESFSLTHGHQKPQVVSLPSAIFSLGKELSDKPLSMLSALRAMYDPRSVALKEYLPAMKDTAGSSGSFHGPSKGMCHVSFIVYKLFCVK